MEGEGEGHQRQGGGGGGTDFRSCRCCRHAAAASRAGSRAGSAAWRGDRGRLDRCGLEAGAALAGGPRWRWGHACSSAAAAAAAAASASAALWCRLRAVPARAPAPCRNNGCPGAQEGHRCRQCRCIAHVHSPASLGVHHKQPAGPAAAWGAAVGTQRPLRGCMAHRTLACLQCSLRQALSTLGPSRRAEQAAAAASWWAAGGGPVGTLCPWDERPSLAPAPPVWCAVFELRRCVIGVEEHRPA